MNYGKFLSTVAIFLISISANSPLAAQIVEQINPANSARQIDVTLTTQDNQTFNELIQQAELQAISLIEQEFATNSSITEVAVTILGDRQGQQVPLLFSRVSRSDWQQQPTIRQWTRYFATSAVLLGFNKPKTTPSSPPAQPPTPITPINQPITPTPSPTSSRRQPPAPASPNNASPAARGASLEETDPGYR